MLKLDERGLEVSGEICRGYMYSGEITCNIHCGKMYLCAIFYGLLWLSERYCDKRYWGDIYTGERYLGRRYIGEMHRS